MAFLRSSDRNYVTALGAASVQDFASTFGAHALAKSVRCIAALLTWLIGTFHDTVLLRNLSDTYMGFTAQKQVLEAGFLRCEGREN